MPTSAAISTAWVSIYMDPSGYWPFGLMNVFLHWLQPPTLEKGYWEAKDMVMRKGLKRAQVGISRSSRVQKIVNVGHIAQRFSPVSRSSRREAWSLCITMVIWVEDVYSTWEWLLHHTSSEFLIRTWEEGLLERLPLMKRKQALLFINLIGYQSNLAWIKFSLFHSRKTVIVQGMQDNSTRTIIFKEFAYLCPRQRQSRSKWCSLW